VQVSSNRVGTGPIPAQLSRDARAERGTRIWIAVITALGTILVAAITLFGTLRATDSKIVSGPVPTSPSTVTVPAPTVTVTVTVGPSGTATDDPSSGRQRQWGPGTIVSGGWVDFDPVPPKNQAGGGDGELFAAAPVNDTEIQAGSDAEIAVWNSTSEPSVSKCLELTSTQAITQSTRVKPGTILCIHTGADRLVIAKVTKAVAGDRPDATVTMTATVWGPA
jgi:hypothetical protein